MLDQEFKMEWVEALRSGAYQQGTGKLCGMEPNGEQYCCLGVAADLLVQKNKGSWVRLEDTKLYWGSEDDANHFALMGDFGRDFIGLDQEDEEELAEKNDGGATFEEIADYIEENL